MLTLKIKIFQIIFKFGSNILEIRNIAAAYRCIAINRSTLVATRPFRGWLVIRLPLSKSVWAKFLYFHYGFKSSMTNKCIEQKKRKKKNHTFSLVNDLFPVREDSSFCHRNASQRHVT